MNVNQKESPVRELLGMNPEGLNWGRLVSFFFAYLLSFLFFNVLEKLTRPISMQFDSWLVYTVLLVLSSFIFTACAAAGFYFVRGTYAAIIVSAIVYCIIITYIRSLFIPKLQPVSSIIHSWCWIFLVLAGLHIYVRRIEKMWLALVTAYFSAAVSLRIIGIATILIRDGVVIAVTVQSELIFIVFCALQAAVFTGLFCIGLKLQGDRLEWADFPSAVTGIAMPGASKPHELSDLKNAADSRMIQKMLRPAAIATILFGIFAIVIGLQRGMDAPPISIILALIGMLLILEGTWWISAPHPVGLLVEGIALIILGVWNILAILSETSRFANVMNWFIVVGSWQIGWGIQSIKHYKYYSYLSGITINQESLQDINDIANNIINASFKEDENLIEFQVKTVFKKTMLKGKLTKGMILFAGPKGELFMDKIHEIVIKPIKIISSAYPIKASLNICGHTFPGEISHKSLERFHRWKSGI